MKSYNTISNALSLSIIDNGDPITWKTYAGGSSDYIKNYLLPYLKSPKVCDSASDCLVTDYKNLEGTDLSSMFTEIIGANPFIVQLADGTTIVQVPGDNVLGFDVNGKKAPNIFGRDLFIVYLTDDQIKDEKKADYLGKPIYLESPNDCLEQKGKAVGCAARLLKEGKMNY